MLSISRIFLLTVGACLAGAAALPAQFVDNPLSSPPGPLNAQTRRQAELVERSNQQMADAVAAKLQQIGRLHGYRIHIRCRRGVVELTGFVADDAMRRSVERTAASVPGALRIVNSLAAGAEIMQTQILQPLPTGAPEAKQGGAQPPVGPQAPKEDAPQAGQKTPEPTPLYVAPPHAAPYAYNPPKMPPYAWPTYAPYNNYSRVAYPTIYPYNAFPFIGPMYPYPKIPLGWRSVSLTWRDGFWWYGRNATGKNWWQVRYW